MDANDKEQSNNTIMDISTSEALIVEPLPPATIAVVGSQSSLQLKRHRPSNHLFYGDQLNYLYLTLFDVNVQNNLHSLLDGIM